MDNANHPPRCQSNYVLCKHSIRFEYIQCLVYISVRLDIYFYPSKKYPVLWYMTFSRVIMQSSKSRWIIFNLDITSSNKYQPDSRTFFNGQFPLGRLGLSVGIISDKDNPGAKYGITRPPLYFITLNKLLQGSNFISDVSLVCWFISLSSDICISFCQN